MIAIAATLFAIVAADTVRPVELSTGTEPRQATRVLRVLTVKAATGVTVHAAAVVVYDPATRLYWFTHLRSSARITAGHMEKVELPPFRFATDGAALYGFRVQGGKLQARRSTERADSPDQAVERAMRAIERELEAGWPARPELPPAQFVEIDLHDVLGTEFLRAGMPIGGPDDSFAVTVHTITLEEGTWRLGIRNRTGEIAPVHVSTDLQLVRRESRGRRSKE